MSVDEARHSVPPARSGKYLTFKLGPGHYGLEILKVREIIGLIEVTAVPLAPPHVKGIINLRGTVIPVVDLRLKFRMDELKPTVETCIIVTRVGEREIGVLVDQVSEVQHFDASAIQPAPAFGQDIDTDFILGIGKVGDHVTLLLDINRVLVAAEVEAVVNVVESLTRETRATHGVLESLSC